MVHQRHAAISNFNRSLRAVIGLVCTMILATTILAHSQTFSVLHYFTGASDGGNPTSGVTVAAPGTLYGTAAIPGAAFRLTERASGWTLDPLHDFTGGSNGDTPYSGLVIGPNGALYGTTNAGGFGVGIVYELRPPATACNTAICNWNETVIHAFTGNIGDGGFPGYGNVTFDQAGNMYGTTSLNGTADCGVVWKLAPSSGGWTESVLYDFAGGTNGCNPESGVVFDAAGNLYGTTACDFLCQGTGTVFQLVPSNGGWTENPLMVLNATTGTHPWGTLIADQSGNFYGTATEEGPNGGGTVFELSPSDGGWTFSLVYSFSSCNPTAGVTLGADGNLYGACEGGGANADGWLFEMPRNCNQTCAPADLHDFSGTDGAGPIGPVVFDASGNLYGTTFEGGIGNCNGGSGGCGVVWEITPN